MLLEYVELLMECFFLGLSFTSQRPAVYVAYLTSNFAMFIFFYVQKQKIAVGKKF
jgi:hypothetical protein